MGRNVSRNLRRPNLSIILALGASRVDGIPTIVYAPEIVRRFTVDKYIQMPAYETADAEAFVTDLLATLVDPNKRTILKVAKSLKLRSLDIVLNFIRSQKTLFVSFAVILVSSRKLVNLLRLFLTRFPCSGSLHAKQAPDR